MAWQLIYTSAPRGLVAGRSGFCTVARHAAIRDRLVSEAERYSGYDRHTAARGARPIPLPAIAAHRILEVAGTRYHLLSRVRDAGLDYTGRGMHIAHHLICEEHEIRGAVSPAQVLRAFPWHDAWNDPPRYFTDGERVNLQSVGQPLPQPAQYWRQLTGRAANAVLLTEHIGSPGCLVLCGEGREDSLLCLFEESLRLLDPDGENSPRLWSVRFTTFLQASENPADFDWRGGWADGSAAAVERGRGSILDITRFHELPAPKNPVLVRYAETGEPPRRQVSVQVNMRGTATSATRPVQLRSTELYSSPAEIARRREQARRRTRGIVIGVSAGIILLMLLGLALSRLPKAGERKKAAPPAPATTNEASFPPTIDKTVTQNAPPVAEATPVPKPEPRTQAEPTPKPEPGPTPKPATPPEPAPGPPAAEQFANLPKEPTYIALVSDLAKGVDLSALFRKHNLPILDAGKVNQAEGLDVKIAMPKPEKPRWDHFPDADRDGRSTTDLRQFWKSGVTQLPVTDLMNELAYLNTQAGLLSRATKASWEVAAVRFHRSNSVFQIVLVDKRALATNAPPFPPIMLDRYLLKVASASPLRVSLDTNVLQQVRLRSYPSTNDTKLRLSSSKLKDLEARVKALDPNSSGILASQPQASFKNQETLDGEATIDCDRIAQTLAQKVKDAEQTITDLRQSIPMKHGYQVYVEAFKVATNASPPNSDGFKKSLQSRELTGNAWADCVDYLEPLIGALVKDHIKPYLDDCKGQKQKAQEVLKTGKPKLDVLRAVPDELKKQKKPKETPEEKNKRLADIEKLQKAIRDSEELIWRLPDDKNHEDFGKELEDLANWGTNTKQDWSKIGQVDRLLKHLDAVSYTDEKTKHKMAISAFYDAWTRMFNALVRDSMVKERQSYQAASQTIIEDIRRERNERPERQKKQIEKLRGIGETIPKDLPSLGEITLDIEIARDVWWPIIRFGEGEK